MSKNKKKIAVTGANGYLGRHVAQYLYDNGYDVYAVDIKNDTLPKKMKYIEKDILRYNENIFEELECPDVLIHLVWRDGFNHNSRYQMGNISAHFDFVYNMLKGGLKNFSTMGSMHEIGYWEGCIDENTPCNPLSQYGIVKNTLRLSFQEMISREFKDVSFKWLRGYYNHGDDEGGNSIFSKLLRADEEGKELFPFTSGKNKYDFLDIREVSEQIVAASLQTEINGVINCCSGKPISLGEMVEAFIREKGLKIKLDYGKFPDRPYDSPVVYGDNTKIAKIMEKFKNEQ